MEAGATAAERRAVLILGEPGGLGVAVARRLQRGGVEYRAAPSLSDAELAELLG